MERRVNGVPMFVNIRLQGHYHNISRALKILKEMGLDPTIPTEDSE